MKFVCMGFAEESKLASRPESEGQRMMEECFAYDVELRRGGHFLGGEALQSARNGVTLRMKNGSVEVTDGPYAETKEMLGGILLLEARDLNHAIALMSQHPGVKLGPFEIRPADEEINKRIASCQATEGDRSGTTRASSPLKNTLRAASTPPLPNTDHPRPNRSSTVRLHRVLRAPVVRVYKAFIDPDALCRWLPPYGFVGEIDRIDPHVGGSYHMSFTNFGTGHRHSFESRFLELIPGERIRMADKFDDPSLAGEMTKTITIRKGLRCCEIEILHEGLPAAIPAEMCYLGWQESLEQLARLVEPEISDGP